MSDTIKFCSNCNITGINEYADAFKKDSNGFNFNKGFIHPYEIKDNNTDICPYCNNKLIDTFITEKDFEIIWNVSDLDRQFLEAMIDLKKKDSIEYQLKLSQFKTQLQQQESSKRAEEDNLPKCPTCGSTNIEKISLGKKAVGGALFGLFSSDVRKTMHCKNCGFKW